MRSKIAITALCVLTTLAIGLTSVVAAKRTADENPAATEAPLSAAGEKLQARYIELLAALRHDIVASLPTVDEQAKAVFLKAYHDEATATKAETQAMVEPTLKHTNEPGDAANNLTAARASLAAAIKTSAEPAKAVLTELEGFLGRDKLDAKLVKLVVLAEATPRALAQFAQQGQEQESLVEKLLGDDDLMKQMLVAGGAAAGKYGRAMEIYSAIQNASPKTKDGLLQRLALATALEHAVPIAQSNPQSEPKAPAIVDPVKRYLYFEKAYLDGVLDPAFKNLTTWEYRNVVNGDEPDAILTWGRDMLWNYRPDEIITPDYRWRYVASVKTEVKYGSQEVKDDLPTLQNYQNIIKDGGVCGRRAFFGRFILRAFGIPTVARPQPGHATLVHWTPEGWVINLGASWGWGEINGASDIDFLAMTQARKDERAYLKVLRARWIADAIGEKPAFGFHSAASGFWNGVALYEQRAIAQASKAVALEAVGQDIAEANESKEKDVSTKVTITDDDRKIVVGPSGAITIPAVACSKPTASTKTIVFLKGQDGAKQLHYGRLGHDEAFEYTFEAPRAGKYNLVAQVVTVSADQTLSVTASGVTTPTTIDLPYTVGEWQDSKPVTIVLNQGRNALRFTRTTPRRGVTIKQFTLTPAGSAADTSSN